MVKITKIFWKWIFIEVKEWKAFWFEFHIKVWKTTYVSCILQLGMFSLSFFSFSERLFNWDKRFVRFGSIPTLPKLILFGFIFLLYSGKISWIQVLQYKFKSLRLLHLIWIHLLHKSQKTDIGVFHVYHTLMLEYKKWNLVYNKKESTESNI